jgi:hypothetical protein
LLLLLLLLLLRRRRRRRRKKQSKGTKHGAPVELCARREWAPMPLAVESDGGGGLAARVF